MLNHYVWNLYLKSGGAAIVEMFRRNLGEKLTEEYAQEIIRLQKAYCVLDGNAEETGEQIHDLIDFYSTSDQTSDYDPVEPEELIEKIYENYLVDYGTPAAAFSNFTFELCYVSTDLSILFPNFFIPYYYRTNFNVLQRITDTFDIHLPEIPVKKDYKGRFFYYLDICNAWVN